MVERNDNKLLLLIPAAKGFSSGVELLLVALYYCSERAENRLENGSALCHATVLPLLAVKPVSEGGRRRQVHFRGTPPSLALPVPHHGCQGGFWQVEAGNLLQRTGLARPQVSPWCASATASAASASHHGPAQEALKSRSAVCADQSFTFFVAGRCCCCGT